MRFKDNPDRPDPDKVPPALDDRITHARLRIAGADIMMSGPTDFDCMSLSLNLPTEADAEGILSALAVGRQDHDTDHQDVLGAALWSCHR
jgi:PhnB protein